MVLYFLQRYLDLSIHSERPHSKFKSPEQPMIRRFFHQTPSLERLQINNNDEIKKQNI